MKVDMNLKVGQETGAAAARATIETLEAHARRGRYLALETAHFAGSGHVGGSLSAMDMLVALYFDQLRIDPKRPDWAERDRFVLSKGHCALGLYVVLAMRGFLPVEELRTFNEGGSRLQMHPDMLLLPGLDISTGSLGQGLSAAFGMALGARSLGLPSHVWALLGDGELQEGMAWEALHVAPRYALGRLTLLLDYNGLQQYGWPRRAGDRGDRRDPWAGVDLPRVLSGLGWRVIEIEGNAMNEVRAALDNARSQPEASPPTAVVARTTKGSGVSFTQNSIKWHTRPPTADELARAAHELGITEGDSR